MQDKIEKLKRLNKQVELIDKQLELLELVDRTEREIKESEQSTPTKFPVGATVRFSTESTEKPYLRGKYGKVIGHSPKFVRVKRGSNTHRRLPKNLSQVFEDA